MRRWWHRIKVRVFNIRPKRDDHGGPGYYDLS